jgi:putative ABC transport system permease protein
MTIKPERVPATRAADIIGLSFSALRQQKVRTILTVTGVVIGTFALVLSLAIGRGVDHAIVSLFHADSRLRKIAVNEKYEITAEEVPASEREPKGAMSEDKRKRIGKALVRAWGRAHVRKERKLLDPDAVRALQRIEHVELVEPEIWLGGKALWDGKTEDALSASTATGATFLKSRLLAGRLFDSQDGAAAIVNEFFLYRLGLAGDDAAPAAIGRTVRFEYTAGQNAQIDLVQMMAFGTEPMSKKETKALESALKRLSGLARFLPIPTEEREALRRVFDRLTTTNAPTGTTYSQDFTIIGVLREKDDDDDKPGPFGNWWMFPDADILMPTEAAVALFLRAPEHVKGGFGSATVTVDQEDHVKEVEKRIGSLGFNKFSLVEFIETVRLNVLMITFATAFVAIVALVVAAVGITNTMIMSVLERSHEIGVMKALGARDRHILLIFLVEGAALGVAGSLIGLLLGWLASIPGDAIAKSIMEPQAQTHVKGTLFLFPPWLVVGVPALVSVITTLAALYPARRAAKVDPVTSLRHE